MSKRSKYLGNEELVYLMPLNKNSSSFIHKIKSVSHKDTIEYTFRFVYDTNFDLPFKTRMKNACESGCKLCFIFGDDEIKNNGVTVKNLIDGEQKFVRCEEIYSLK